MVRVDEDDPYAVVGSERHHRWDFSEAGNRFDNSLRAAWGAVAVQAHALATGEACNKHATQDLIGNVLHRCVQTGLSSELILASAIESFVSELHGNS
ncbi:hypothetical protein [Saccharopolyspora elongata]|uniref:hypothetical protein n=1 Tax=Saccharopolyspora elongata TaxID=2530387 RepID=UPI001046387F|nr:hypothetical protein [Saccharopolyspora elongata]